MNIFKKIIDTFKDYIEVQDDDLSFLEVGDIVLARRYQTDDEKNKIKEGHRESPFVIISKEKVKQLLYYVLVIYIVILNGKYIISLK